MQQLPDCQIGAHPTILWHFGRRKMASIQSRQHAERRLTEVCVLNTQLLQIISLTPFILFQYFIPLTHACIVWAALLYSLANYRSEALPFHHLDRDPKVSVSSSCTNVVEQGPRQINHQKKFGCICSAFDVHQPKGHWGGDKGPAAKQEHRTQNIIIYCDLMIMNYDILGRFLHAPVQRLFEF